MIELRHVGDKIPISAWLVAVVELAERFTYYGLTGPFQNYMQNRRDDPLHPGALGLGQSSATALQYFFQFCKYTCRESGCNRGLLDLLTPGSNRVLCHSNPRRYCRRCLVRPLQRYCPFCPNLCLRSRYPIRYVSAIFSRERCRTWWSNWCHASSWCWNWRHQE